MSNARKHPNNVAYSSDRITETLAIRDVIEVLASLDLDRKPGFWFTLDYRPVKPGSFAIHDSGITDDRQGRLDGPGGVCGEIDYKTGRGRLDLQALAKRPCAASLAERTEWEATYDYDTSELALDLEIESVPIRPTVRKLRGPPIMEEPGDPG